MLFTAYYDESGTHDASPITVLGGFIGNVDDWANFEREWSKILRKHDLPFVRAKQLFHRQGPYRKWGEKQFDYLWADILYVFQEYKHIAVTKTVLNNDDYYRSYLSGGPLRRERLDSKYALCLRVCLNFHPVAYHNLHNEGAINYVLEAGHRNAGDAVRVFNELKSRSDLPWAHAIGAISFGTKRDFPALQAADLISYWFYKTEMEKIAENFEDPYHISDLELDLARCGLAVLEHTITPLDLANLRQNFLAKTKRRVFGKAKAILRADESIPDAWGLDSAKRLIGLELSVDELRPFEPRRRSPKGQSAH